MIGSSYASAQGRISLEKTDEVFHDVKAASYYADAVKWARENSIVNDTGKETFGPDANMTRAALWAVLGRAAGADVDGGSPWYPGFHDALSKGRVPLICCPENDFDITVKLADIFSLNDVASVTIVTMDKPCCAELKDMVLRAVKQSRLPIPVQVTNLFVDAEEVD